MGNVGLAARSQATTSSDIKTFLSRYFYFSMTLLMAGISVWGFTHTVVMVRFEITVLSLKNVAPYLSILWCDLIIFRGNH